MKAEVMKKDGNVVEFSVEVETSEVEKAIKRAYKKVANEVNIPGFRKGKIPPAVIDAKVGKEVVHEEAMNELINSTVFAAIKELNLKPIDNPEITDYEFEEGKPFKYTGKVEVTPEFELPPIEKVEAEKKQAEVTEEEVTEQLERLRERFARLEAKPIGNAEKGDFALISFEGQVEGNRIEEASMQDYLVEIGSNTLMPEFEKHLFGTKAGDIKKFSIEFPPDHHEKKIAGKKVDFSVIVKEIKRKVLPEANDEFAKEVGDFESLEKLKDLLRERILAAKEQQLEIDYQNEILRKYVEMVEVQPPEKLVSSEIEKMIVDLAYDLARQGLKLEDYLNYMQLDLEKLKASMKPDAEMRVKTRLVLEKIVDEQGIKVTEEELDHEIMHLAQQYGYQLDELKKLLEERNELGSLAYDIVLNKAYVWLINKYKEFKGELKEEETEKSEETEEAAKSEAQAEQEKTEAAEIQESAQAEASEKPKTKSKSTKADSE